MECGAEARCTGEWTDGVTVHNGDADEGKRRYRRFFEDQSLTCGLLFTLFFFMELLFSSCLSYNLDCFSREHGRLGCSHRVCSAEKCAGNKRHVAHGSTETPRSASEIAALGIIAIEGHFEFEDGTR